MKRIRTIAVLPTMFTLGNLVCGFFAIVVASRIAAPESAEVVESPAIDWLMLLPQLDKSVATHNMLLCAMLIFLAMLFDALDGQMARLAKTTSDFGAQLDSLCDLVTFGVAPAILLVKMCPSFSWRHPQQIWIIAALYSACAAMRLARYNVEASEDDDPMHFSGLPSPAAAASIAGFAILSYTLRSEADSVVPRETIDWWMQFVLPIFAVLVALLMVSRVPYPHLMNQVLGGQRSFGHVVTVVFAVVAIILIKGYSVPILCCVFVLGPPIRYLVVRIGSRQAREEPFFD